MLNESLAAEGLAPEDFDAVRKPLLEGSMLPTRSYVSGAFYEREVETIFRKEWFCVGREEQLEKPGDYFTLTMVGEPLVAVRDQNGRINVFSRVCRHRGALIAEGEGNAKGFECPYHAWTYSLQGKLVGAPYMNKTKAFAKADCQLPTLRVECWEGFIFANFDAQAAPLGPQLENLSARLAPYKLKDMRIAKALTYTGAFNWKVILENNCEGYHHCGAHKISTEPYYPAHLCEAEDQDGRVIFLNSYGRSALHTSLLPHIEGLPEEAFKKAINPVVLPSHIMFMQWDLMTYFQVFPEGPEQTTFRLTVCFPRTTFGIEKYEEALQGLWDSILLVNEEDNRVLLSAHKGLRAGLAQAGRYCYLDKGVHQFHQYVLERITHALR